MGRQIRFYQTQKDVEELCATLYSQGIRLFDRKGNEIEDYTGKNIYEDFYSGTKTKVRRFFIAYKTTVFDKSSADRYEFPTFELIEYSTCNDARFGDPYYNDGRFYLSNDIYDNADLVKLYNTLVKYVRKHYVYACGYYFAPDFIKMFREGKVVPCNGNQTLFESGFGEELIEKLLKFNNK